MGPALSSGTVETGGKNLEFLFYSNLELGWCGILKGGRERSQLLDLNYGM